MANLPTIMSSLTDALVRILFQMSIVNRVEAELNIESRSDISAAIITDIINPRRPETYRNGVMISNTLIFKDPSSKFRA